MSSDTGGTQPPAASTEKPQTLKPIASFGSSVINKSTRKFAPKAVQRRRLGAPQAPQGTLTASARSSVDRQIASGTPQPPTIRPTESTQPDTENTTPSTLSLQNTTQLPTQSVTGTGASVPTSTPSSAIPATAIYTAAGDTTASPIHSQVTAANEPTQLRIDISRTSPSPESRPQEDNEHTILGRSPKRRRIQSPRPAQPTIAKPVASPISAVSEPAGLSTLATSTPTQPAQAISTQSESLQPLARDNASGRAPTTAPTAILSQTESTTSTSPSSEPPNHRSLVRKDISRLPELINDDTQAEAEQNSRAGGQEDRAITQNARETTTPTPTTKSRGKRKTIRDNSAEAPEQETNGDAQRGTVKKPRKVRKDKGQPRKRKVVATVEGEQTEQQEGASEAPPKRKRVRKKAAATTGTETGGAPTGEGQDGELGGNEPRRKGRQKATTPEGAEDVTIAPSMVSMGSLAIKDPRNGKLSARELAMREIDWPEVIRRRKEQQLALANSDGTNQDEVNKRLEEAGRERAAAQTRGPQLRIVDGNIILDQTSLVVDRHAEATRDEDTLEAVEEDDLTTRVNVQSWILAGRRDPADRIMLHGPATRWSAAQTESFYDALRMFGTDFQTISTMFPGKTRRRIKHKFVKEERENPERVKAALTGPKDPIDFQKYLDITGKQADSFKDPRELELELKEEDERQKIEIEKQKQEYQEMQRQKQFAGAGDSDEEGAGGGVGDSAKENRGQEQGGAGAKGKGKKKKKDKRLKHQPLGGEEAEVLGTIDD